MNLSPLDWIIIGSYFTISLAIGLSFAKRASKNINEYFVSGRHLPWWIIGTSMVATTFASDTPLAITGIVAKNGIAGNWFWWSVLMAQVTATYFFAPLWRRSGVITEAQLNEIRFDGKPGATLQFMRATYVGLIHNCVILGWVILGMSKALDAGFGLPKEVAVGICIVLTLGYSIFSGFWGVVITDMMQFILAMIGSILFAWFAVDHVGGMNSLQSQLHGLYNNADELLSFIPSWDSEFMPLSTFLVYICIQWWADHKVIGGSYMVQRMAAAKSEGHAAKGTLWFTIAHYALRPWPWIIVALCALVVFPNLPDPEKGYPMLMFKILPSGVLGILVTSFLAAFMSTVDTHLNMGSSFMVNDIYKRFLKPKADPKHYVLVARICTVSIMIIAAIGSFYMESIGAMWKFLVMLEAGIGLVYIAKWYWWRVNAWSEISAMTSSLVISLYLNSFTDLPYETKLISILCITTFIWITVTLFTKPTSEGTLSRFYIKVRPWHLFWGPIAKKHQQVEQLAPFLFGTRVVSWFSTIAFVYSMLFGIGYTVLGYKDKALLPLAVALIAGGTLYFQLKSLSQNRWHDENN